MALQHRRQAEPYRMSASTSASTDSFCEDRGHAVPGRAQQGQPQAGSTLDVTEVLEWPLGTPHPCSPVHGGSIQTRPSRGRAVPHEAMLEAEDVQFLLRPCWELARCH